MIGQRCAPAAIAAVLLLAAHADASPRAASKRFLVPTSSASSGFGPYREGGKRPAAVELRRVFGAPDRARRGQLQTCVLRWYALGISAKTFRVGDPPNPCKTGELAQARLTKASWHTAAGVHPGSSESVARRASLKRCTQTSCGATGYALELHRSDCAGASVAGVIAEVRDGRVVALIVRSRGCE